MGIFSKNKTTEKQVDPLAEESSTPVVLDHDTKNTNTNIATSVVLRPLVTEKNAVLASHNAYAFAVRNTANKIEVSQAVRSMYGVVPTRVNMINVRGKVVRRGKTVGKRKSWKKAIVVLPKGKTINIYEGV